MATTERPLFIKISLPDGLEESLESLARQVLKQNPANIHAFAAQHFQNLHKKAGKDAGILEDIAFPEKFYTNFYEPPDEVVNDDEKYKEINVKKGEEENADEAAEDERSATAAAGEIQEGFKENQERQELIEDNDEEKYTEINVRKDEEEAVTEAANEEERSATAAAEEIQEGFKENEEKKEIGAYEEEKTTEINVRKDEGETAVDAADKIQEGFQENEERKEIPADEGQDTDQERRSATLIQAGLQGSLDQQGVEEGINRHNSATLIQAGLQGSLDLKDIEEGIEANDSATIIQSGMHSTLDQKDFEEDIIKGNTSSPRKISNVLDTADPTLNEAANVIQAGLSGITSRKKLQIVEEDNIVPTHLESQEATPIESNTSDEREQEAPEILFYHYRGSTECQKVMIALTEKQIPFKAFHVDLRNNEQFSTWFLEINPRAEVPVLKTGEGDLFTNVDKIIHYLDEIHPKTRLIPSTNDTEQYQLFIHFNAILSQIKLEELKIKSELDQFGDTPEKFNMRVNIFLQKAEDSLAHAPFLRERAAELEQKKAFVQNNFQEVVNDTETALATIENHLKNISVASDGDDCVEFMIGETLSFIDIILGVTLNQLALLGYGEDFWLGHEEKPTLRFYLNKIRSRAAFEYNVPEFGRNEKRILSPERDNDEFREMNKQVYQNMVDILEGEVQAEETK